MSKLMEVFLVFFKLGLTSFGGPIAHLGYFHEEFVRRRHWIDEQSYADLVALCQFLPGPASSQVGMALGLSRAGMLGAVVAWLGFTLPSAMLLTLFGLGVTHYQNLLNSSVLHGLKIVAVAVVAQALWAMAVKLCPDFKRASLAILVGGVVLSWPSAWGQIAILVVAAAFGFFFLKDPKELPHTPMKVSLGKYTATFCLMLFVALLIGLPILAKTSTNYSVKYFDSFYRAGSLVFGGGHVVLPLLQAEVVPAGWLSKDAFMAGYGAAQAVPGPLFTFSAYVGAASQVSPNGWIGAIICLLAAFLPSFLLVVGALPFWEQTRKHQGLRDAMSGLNAGVVGLLLAALYNPVWISAIFSVKDFCLAVAAFVLLHFLKTPPWLVVLLGAVSAGLIT